MKLTKDFLINIVKAASKSHPDEIGCDDCYSQIHAFAELKLEGKSAEEAMPLIEDHLNRCVECKEEFEVLLEALRAEQNSE